MSENTEQITANHSRVIGRLHGMLTEFERQSNIECSPQNNPYIATRSAAAAEMIREDDGFRWLMQLIISNRMKVRGRPESANPARDVNHFHKSVDYAMEGIESLESSAGKVAVPGIDKYLTLSPWIAREFLWLMIQRDDLSERFQYAMEVRNVSTTIEQRYISEKVTLTRLMDRFGDRPVNGKDFGTGLGLGPKQVSLREPTIHPFKTVTVYKQAVGTDIKPWTEEDEELTAKVNSAANDLAVPGDWIGIDLWHDDREAKHWAISNRWRPGEGSAEERLRYRYFVEWDCPFLKKVDLDILTEDKDQLDEAMGEVPTDVAVFSTVFNQWTSRQARRAIKNIKPYMSDNGLIFVSDFASIDPRSLSGIRIDKTWSSYNTLVFDMAESDRGWQHLFEASNGRATKIMMGLGSIAIEPGGEHYTMDRLLRET